MKEPSREQVVAIVEARVANEDLWRDMLATEATLRGLAERLGENPDFWGLAGLADHLDCEETGDDFSRQGLAPQLGSQRPCP